MGNTKLINTIRWTARIIGTLMAAFVLLFGIGYLIEGLMKPNNGDANGLKTGTIIGFVIWGIGLAALILAIWKPATGGLISFISIIVFNILSKPFRQIFRHLNQKPIAATCKIFLPVRTIAHLLPFFSMSPKSTEPVICKYVSDIIFDNL